MADLFANSPSEAAFIPLAERLRPKDLDQVIGQQHLLGEGGPLRIAFESGIPHSMILWGPPGVGKTTLARLMADAFHAEYIALSAVFSGVKDIREAMERAELNRSQGKHTLLFVDEVHRFNKSQQDAFLPYVESGTITFIGATTENPSFEVNSALLSRARVYVLEALKETELQSLINKSLDNIDGSISIPEECRSIIASYADGDARKLINLLQQIFDSATQQNRPEIDKPFLEHLLTGNVRRFDKGGENFYDQISALHKSVRGSNPDAALYWFCRMLDGGADPLYLSRRLIRMAWEDIGLADPRAARIALDAAETYAQLGSPEGELALAQAVLYLASAPKSNAGYNAYNTARAYVAKDQSRPVPIHLRNAPTRLMKELGYGKTYRYAHDEPEAYAAGECYFPDNMPEPNWYQPVPRGLELKIRDKLAYLRNLDALAGKND